MTLSKKERLLDVLDTSDGSRGLAMIQIDPRGEDVLVPGWLKNQPQLVLKLAYGFRFPVFEIDDEGIYVSLSFNQQRSMCSIPWDCLYAIGSPDTNEGWLFPESVPPEIQFEGVPRKDPPEPWDDQKVETDPEDHIPGPESGTDIANRSLASFRARKMAKAELGTDAGSWDIASRAHELMIEAGWFPEETTTPEPTLDPRSRFRVIDGGKS